MLHQGVQLTGPAVDSELPGPQSAQPLDRQARREFNARYLDGEQPPYGDWLTHT